jgi:hypothetical protein
MYLFDEFAFCLTKSGDEILIQLGKLISLVVYQHVLIHPLVAFANALHKSVSVKYLLGSRGDPASFLRWPPDLGVEWCKNTIFLETEMHPKISEKNYEKRRNSS